MVTLSQWTTKFAKQLLELYESGEHVLVCFAMYIGFIMKHGGEAGRKNLKLIEPWQYKDMQMAIWNDKVDYRLEPLEVAWNKSRRSGKTQGATLIAVFYALLNMEVRWRSGYMKQQTAALMWFELNPFVRKINRIDRLIYLHGNTFFPIDYGVLTPANVTGVECDAAFFDEGGWVFKHLQLYEAYRNARPMVAPSNFKHILHFSTPARSSAFAEAWDELKNLEMRKNIQLTVLRTASDCHWITPEWIEYERNSHADCPWYIDQNYFGIFVVYGGSFFTNFYDLHDYVNVPQAIRDKWHTFKPSHGGVDWNGEHTQHFLGLMKITDDYIFVLEEKKFWDIEFLKPYQNTHSFSLELEDEDPWSKPFADDAKAMGLRCHYFGWNEETKGERCRQVKHRTVIIDKVKCPITYKNFQEAAFDPNSRLPKLEKRPDQHGLDTVLHGVHLAPSVLVTESRPPRHRGLFPEKMPW